MRNKTKRTIAKALTALITAAFLTSSASAFVKGDADGNGIVNVRDCTKITQTIARGQGSTLDIALDYNGDKAVNVRDAAAIAKDLSEVIPVITKTTTKATVKTTAKPSSKASTQTTSQTTSKPVKQVRDKVYVTPTGRRYHYSGSCNGGHYELVPLEEALGRELTPCKKCVH